MKSYIVTKDADVLAPDWLTVRINYKSTKYIYEFKDGHAVLKGVRIGNEIAEIGD